MNKDQMKGRAKEVAGKMKKKTGHAIGNPTMESEGAILEVKGKSQRKIGDLKHKISERTRKA